MNQNLQLSIEKIGVALPVIPQRLSSSLIIGHKQTTLWNSSPPIFFYEVVR